MDVPSFIPSGRGVRKALFKGYIYTRHRAGASSGTWHCTERHSKCKGRAKMNNIDSTVTIIKSHNHRPDFGTVKASKLMAKAKKRCIEEPNVLPAVVTREKYSQADHEALIALPRESSVKASLRRLRRKNLPQLPSSLEELENIPLEYQSINGDRWLIHDSVGGEHRYLIFGRSSTTNAMARSRM